MNRSLKQVTKAVTAGLVLTVAAGGITMPAAHAENGVQPVTFEITGGSLALAQTPAAPIALVGGTAVDMPVTTVTDARNDFGRSGAWAVTANASDLVAASATIDADQITLAQSGSFTSGTGTVDAEPVGLVSASDDSIDSVYTYTPTATLAVQSHPYSGSYTGTVTQTVT
jgi:hypothetical protein